MVYTKLVKAVAAATLLTLMLGISATANAQTNPLDQARIAFSNQEFLEAARYYKQALVENSEDKMVLTEAGDTYMKLQFFDTAAMYYQRAYEEDKRSEEINRKLGTALSMAGEHEKAIESLRRAYKLDDKSLESSLALADGFIRIGSDSLNQAELLILKTDDEYPDNARVHVALGDLYFTRKIYQLAQDNYNKAIEINENLIEARLQLGETYIALANRDATTREEINEYYSKALEQFNIVTKLDPKNAPSWRRQGEILYLAGEYEKAIASFRRYTQQRPDDPITDIYMMDLWTKLKNPANAIPFAERIIERTDETSKEARSRALATIAQGYYLLGQLAKNEEQLDSAMYYYTKSATAYTSVPDTSLDANDYIFQGTALMWKGDTAQGVSVWKKSITAFPDSCMTSFSVARQLFSMKRYDDVIEVFNSRQATCPDEDNATKYLLIGLSHLSESRAEEALENFNRMVAIDSSDINGYYWIMNTMAAQKQTENIPPIFEAMKRNVPDDADADKLAAAYYFYGISKFNAKEFKEALEPLEKAIEIKPDYAQAYLFIAVSYHSLKDKDNACKYYRKTLQYDPGNGTAESNLKKLGC